MPTVQVCLQWTAVIFNTFTLIIGSLAALAGVYDLLYKLEEGSANHIDIQKLVQFAIAGTLILAAIIGCCGAFLGSIKVLVVHLLFMVLLIAAHGWKLSHYNETKQLNSSEVFVMGKWMKELTHPGSMQHLQQTYKCCGNRGYLDYVSLKMMAPASCYHIENRVQALYPYSDGCMTAVMRKHLHLYIMEKWVHIGLIGYEIVGIILTITLCCQLTTKTRRYTY